MRVSLRKLQRALCVKLWVICCMRVLEILLRAVATCTQSHGSTHVPLLWPCHGHATPCRGQTFLDVATPLTRRGESIQVRPCHGSACTHTVCSHGFQLCLQDKCSSTSREPSISRGHHLFVLCPGLEQAMSVQIEAPAST